MTHDLTTRRHISPRIFTGMAAVAALIMCQWTFSADIAPTEKDLNEYGEKISKAVEDSNLTDFNDLIDWNAILKEALSKPENPELEKSRKEFKVEFRKAIRSKEGICGAIIKSVEEGGDYTMIHSDLGRHPFVMFRLIIPNNGGVNYHKYLLGRDSEGALIANDLYIFLSAEPLTATFRRGWDPLANQILKSKLADGSNKDEESKKFVESIELSHKFLDLVNNMKDAEALDLFQTFPEELRRDKNLLISRMRAAQRVSDQEYTTAIEDIRKYHPEDSALDFLFIDGYLLQKKYDEALACIDKTYESVGGDSYLLVMRANVLLQSGKVEEALKTIQKAVEDEPELEQAYSIGLDITLAAKDYAETARFLTKLEKDFDYTWKDLTGVEVFSEFVKSPEFKTWLERNK